MLLIILATFLLPLFAQAEEITPCAVTPPIQDTPTEISDHTLSLPLLGGGENINPISVVSNTENTNIQNNTPRLPVRGELRINELLAVPSDGAFEWVEIKNKSSTTLSLEGITLVDGADHRVALGGAL